jgi:phosphate transport system protein
MERPFDEELTNLKKNLLEMASLVEEAVGDSVKSLKERREELARGVFDSEKAINLYDVTVDEICMRLLALRQPVAADLRFITAAMRICGDLERMGDQAVNIAERSLELIREPLLKPLIDIPEMAHLAQSMVKDAIDAFVRGDENLAQRVCERDDQVDALNDQAFRVLLTYALSDPQNIPRAVNLILIARSLERVADHATNIGEEVIYMRLGKIIKHGRGRDKEGGSSPPVVH